MRKALEFFIIISMFVLLVGCNKTNENVTKEENKTSENVTKVVNVSNEYIRYDVSEKNKYALVGFGAQMDTDIFMPYNKMTEDDEKMLEDRIKEMKIQYTRIKYFCEYFEQLNDNDDPNSFDINSDGVKTESVEMKALYKVLDLCEKYNIKVDFSVYGAYNWFESSDGTITSSWLATSSEKVAQQWVTAPKDYYEYAESISAVLDYLINTKGYTCIYGLSIISEMFIDEESIKNWSEYVECCKIINDRLNKDGLRDKIKFIGCSEQGGSPSYYKEEFESVKDIFDVCCTGNYSWDNTCLNESIYNFWSEMMETVEEYNKDGFAISEFCEGKHFLDAVNKTDIDDYTAGLYIARFCIEASRAGVNAFDHYILGDVMFGTYIHTMGLWMYRDSNITNSKYISWAAHPEWYFYSMFSKYTDTGSYSYKLEQKLKSVYDSEDPDIAIVAYNNPDGTWTYFIANSGSESKKVAVVNTIDSNLKEMDCYKITESWIPENRECVLPTSYKTIDVSDSVAYATVPANGLVVITSK